MIDPRASGDPRTILLAAAAGSTAAAVWAIAEPRVAHRLGHDFTDVRLFGRVLGGERFWRPLGTGAHLVNGASFGVALALSGPLTVRRTVGWVALETVVTWPLISLADAVHPDRRSGRWPRLVTDRRVMAQEAMMHALFALVLAGLFAVLGLRR